MLEHDEIRFECLRDEGLLPLPLGEGWGEGLRSLVKSSAPSRIAIAT